MSFFEGVRMALDPLVTFGVKQVDELDAEWAGQGCEWKIFKELADKLIKENLQDMRLVMQLIL